MDPTQAPGFDAIANDQVKKAFVGHAPTCVEWLEPGTRLYKWSKSIGGPNGISPWWLFLEARTLPDGAHCGGLRERQEFARRLNVHDRDYHRVRAGVTRQWNPMTRPVAIRLNNGAWGYIGKAAGQLQDETVSNVALIAGDCQVWIPGLKASDVTQISIVPYLTVGRSRA